MKFGELLNYDASPRKILVNCDGRHNFIVEKSGRQ